MEMLLPDVNWKTYWLILAHAYGIATFRLNTLEM